MVREDVCVLFELGKEGTKRNDTRWECEYRTNEKGTALSNIAFRCYDKSLTKDKLYFMLNFVTVLKYILTYPRL